MPLFKSKSRISETEDGEVRCQVDCKYIGSQAIDIIKRDDYQRLLDEILNDIKEAVRGVSVALVISTEGIKTFGKDGKTVKLAHAITKIASSTCNPERRLFAYVARTNQSKDQGNMQAHIFRTKKTSHAQQLGTFASRAFRLAVTRATIVRDRAIKNFEEENLVSDSAAKPAQATRRRWAKQELAKGHDYSEHANRARRSNGVLIAQQFESSRSFKNDASVFNSPPASPPPITNDLASVDLSEDLEAIQPVHDVVATEELDGTSESQDTITESAGTTQSLDAEPENNVVNEEEKFESTEVSNEESQECGHEDKDDNVKTPLPESENITNLLNGYEDRVLSPISDASSPTQRTPHNGTSEYADSSSRRKVSNLILEEDLLAASDWYQEGLTRELCEEALADSPVGSFLVRASQSKPGSYGLSLCCQAKPNFQTTNFLIMRLEDTRYQIQGCNAVFASLTTLIAHYASYRDELPIALRLGENNPLFFERQIMEDINMNKDETIPLDLEINDPDFSHYSNSDTIMRELQRASMKGSFGNEEDSLNR